MPYNHRRPKLVINILTILGMIIVTSAVTILCIRFGIVMTTTPIQASKGHHTTNGRSISNNRSKLLVSPDTAVELNATNNSISRDQQGMRINLPGSTLTGSENQSLANYLSFNHLEQENSGSLSDIGEAGSSLVKPSTSKNVAPPTDLRDKSINTNLYNGNGYITTMGDNSENNDEDDNNNMYQINGRQISRRKINYNHQLNTNTAKYATIAEEDGSNGYKNAYDLTYNMNDYEHKENENPDYEPGWTSAGRPEQAQGSFWSGSSGSWEPPPYETGEGYLVDQGPSRKPLDKPLSSPTRSNLNTLQPNLDNINWRTIGILALFKLGLAKLQAIGFLNTLFQIGLSFKLYMTAVFFNFLLIMKLMKFFKILLIPLLLTRLLPLFMQLLMIPGRLLDLMRRMNNNNMMPASQSGGSLPGQTSGLLPNRQPGTQPGGVRPGGLLPNQPGAALPGNTQRGGMFRATIEDTPTSESAAVSYNIANKTNNSVFKLEDTYLTDRQSHESIQLSDPTLDIFQKLLDSEKCVERIACRISVAENIGNVPIWINWQVPKPISLHIIIHIIMYNLLYFRVLHRVHQLIPSDKLESYLKAYKDVNNAIHAKSSVPDNWITWPGSNQRRTLAVCIRVTIILSLTIAAVAIVAATFLYVVLGQQTPETSKPVQDLRGDRPVANTRAASGERLIPENRSAVEYLPPNRRSMDGRPKASIGIRLPLADSGIHDMSASRNRYPNNHRYSTSDGVVASPENYDETGVTFDAKTQQNFNRQINHFDYSNLDTDNWTTEKDGSTGYHDSSDLTYNMGAYSNKQTDDLAGINELHREPVVELDTYYSTINGPYYNNRPSESHPIIDHQPLSTDYKLPSKSYQPPTTNYQLPSSNYQLPNTNYYQPTDIIYQSPSTNYNTPSKNYEPPKIPQVPQKPNLDSPQQKIETPIPNTSSVVDWRLLGHYATVLVYTTIA
ncbi:uncharacterized protein LOC111031038 [Myzus persicae]|uniref:uncharacterized protein LOC111031038 n=1 Tax=Myzus persicae TaxID=13164 RepID=UPI000B931B45|nr:uncharacterized protein LOC111031038 [Myzus persicae]